MLRRSAYVSWHKHSLTVVALIGIVMAPDAKSRVRGEGSNMVFEHHSMAQLADYLSRPRSIHRPPENPPDAKQGAERAISDPGFAARVASQLGLKLDARTAPARIPDDRSRGKGDGEPISS